MAKYPINLYKTAVFTELSVSHKNKAVGVTWTPRCSSHFQCSLPGVIPHAALDTILRETLPKLQWSTLSPSLLLLYALHQQLYFTPKVAVWQCGLEASLLFLAASVLLMACRWLR